MSLPKRPAKSAKRASKAPASVNTPLSDRQRALAQQEAALQEEIRQREQFLQDAPKRREEEQRKQRDELLSRAAHGTRRFDSRAALVDNRYNFQTAKRGKRKALKSEQQAARLKFFALLLVLIGLAFWLYTAVR